MIRLLLVALVALAAPAGAGDLAWTQTNASLVSTTTVQLCWDQSTGRACTSQSVAGQTATDATPRGKNLVVTLTPVPVDPADAALSGSASFTMASPEPVLGLSLAQSGIAAESISNNGGYNVDISTGSADWKSWGTATNEKSGASLIGDLAVVSGTGLQVGTLSDVNRPGLSWASGGTPTASMAEIRDVMRAVPLGAVGTGLSFAVASSSTVQREVWVWVRTQNAVATASIALNGQTQSVSVGDQVLSNDSQFDYYLIKASIFGAGTAQFQLVNTAAGAVSVAVLGAAVYE